MPAPGQPPPISSEPPLRSVWRRVKKFAIALLIVYLGLIGMLAWLQRSLMYQGRKGPVQVADAAEHANHLREWSYNDAASRHEVAGADFQKAVTTEIDKYNAAKGKAPAGKAW